MSASSVRYDLDPHIRIREYRVQNGLACLDLVGILHVVKHADRSDTDCQLSCQLRRNRKAALFRIELPLHALSFAVGHSHQVHKGIAFLRIGIASIRVGQSARCNRHFNLAVLYAGRHGIRSLQLL